MFKNSSAFWNWLVTSSSDPTQVALTVKGIVTAVIPVLAFLIHTPNLSSLPDEIYSFVVAFFGVFASLLVVIGLVRKILWPTAAFTASLSPARPYPMSSTTGPSAGVTTGTVRQPPPTIGTS